MARTDGFRAFVKVRGKDVYRSRTEAEIAALRRRRARQQEKLKPQGLRLIVAANDP
jgi:hypothetical protein